MCPLSANFVKLFINETLELCIIPTKIIILFQNKDKYFLDSANKISVFFETEALEEDGKLKVHPRVSLNKVNYLERKSLTESIFAILKQYLVITLYFSGGSCTSLVTSYLQKVFFR